MAESLPPKRARPHVDYRAMFLAGLAARGGGGGGDGEAAEDALGVDEDSDDEDYVGGAAGDGEG